MLATLSQIVECVHSDCLISESFFTALLLIGIDLDGCAVWHKDHNDLIKVLIGFGHSITRGGERRYSYEMSLIPVNLYSGLSISMVVCM